MTEKSPRTPCIGICSTALGDDVCRGCKRFAQEVIDWVRYNAEQRRAVLARLDSLLAQTVQSRLHIFNANRLQEQIQFQQITCDANRNPYCLLFELLRHGAGQIEQLEEYGVTIKTPYKRQSLPELKAAIDRDYYELSCAYYTRYIVPGQRALADSPAE